MIMIDPYREGDEELVVHRGGDDWGANETGVKLMAAQYPAFTFMTSERIIMVMGIWKLWEGNWECWSIPSDEARGHAFEVVSRTRHLLDSLPSMYQIFRFTAVSREDKVEYNKWLRLLGFEREYVQEKAYDGRLDVYGYRRLVT